MQKYPIILFVLMLFTAIGTAQTDTTAPVLRCKTYNDLNIRTNATCAMVLWPEELIDTVWDNSGGVVTLGARKICSGSVFKNYLYYTVEEIGSQTMEIQATDPSGNSSRQQCTFFITNVSNCDPTVSVETWTPKGLGIHNFALKSEVTNCYSPHPFTSEMWFYGYAGVGPSYGYHSRFGVLVPIAGLSGKVYAVKNENPLNGVTTVDLAIINRYILGLDTLSPYQIIAADANQDGKVTSFDIVTLRKLLLGVTDTLPNNKSWRFLPHSYVFPDKTNPFPFPESIPVLPETDPPVNRFAFTGIKIGDVNYSADPGN